MFAQALRFEPAADLSRATGLEVETRVRKGEEAPRGTIVVILSTLGLLALLAIIAEVAARAQGGGAGTRGRIFVLENGLPRALEVRFGITDGTNTEVNGRDLKEGLEVITGRAAGSGPPSTPRPASGPPRIF